MEKSMLLFVPKLNSYRRGGPDNVDQTIAPPAGSVCLHNSAIRRKIDCLEHFLKVNIIHKIQ
ncbi:MAG: hypothetical protein DRQ97_05705 [Gammaproteobacteria bacterium]|nr:MAG: hypothetical protein DRQ97_05705 [Gammaproteobacteria bacterium]